MPLSTHLQISRILEQVIQINPSAILDVGCGLGICSALSRIGPDGDNLFDRGNLAWNKKENWKIRIDGIEAFEKYVTEFHKLVHNEPV